MRGKAEQFNNKKMKDEIIIIGDYTPICTPKINFETLEDVYHKEKGSLEESIEFKIKNTLQEINKIQRIITKERGVIPPNFYQKKRK